MEFEPVIGLEVHAQLKTKTKIFCGCSAEFGAPPNSHVCPVCLGMPGVLPVLNRAVVECALRMALATGCTIARTSRFARKNYFYPDLPKGYQISQYELPIAAHGHVDLDSADGPRRIRIRRIHMEEDAGKLSHDPHRPVSRVDLNRAGVPLIEIVSEPDIGSPAEAGDYLRQLRAIVRYLEVCDGNLEEGSFRCDANVSVRPKGAAALGTRTELKNLNSFRFVEKAIEFEIERQKEVLLEGGRILQETRLWDQALGRTVPMRGKEEAHDYRYFPDPDLLPLSIEAEWIERVRGGLPELPAARKARFVEQHGLPAYDAGILTADRELADYFEECVQRVADPKTVSNWVMGPLLGLLNAGGLSAKRAPIPAAGLAGLLALVGSGAVSAKSAKAVFEEMAASGRSAEAIVAEKGLAQISDDAAIEALVREILERNPREVEAYRGGKTKLMGFFVGEAMKATRGRVNPKAVNTILSKLLNQ
ncbi:MAG: Asp-tRNA(Asn)/Glu-tRNA(Gln) amidotransferase subunit GatB [Desulfobacterales bacterium]|jgi:aspartyl-tRNA(Asn)/glutamyl-tRNA(Gln) amidotransferase subunit B|nr:Asp-tRNA(Asn)/Glu-tRNA(Gln) amidotransferase subunit GatB [Desulfobacterales bacterium]